MFYCYVHCLFMLYFKITSTAGKTLLVIFLTSCGIELLQFAQTTMITGFESISLPPKRSTDIDDIILNTLSGLIGILLAYALPSVRKRINKRRWMEIVKETLLWKKINASLCLVSKNSTVVKSFYYFCDGFCYFEIINIATGIDYPSLKENLTSQSPEQIFIMFIVGLIAVTQCFCMIMSSLSCYLESFRQVMWLPLVGLRIPLLILAVLVAY